MEAWRGLFCLTFLCFLLHVRGENGDFDLADALNNTEPTKKPTSGENGDFDLAEALNNMEPTKKPSSGNHTNLRPLQPPPPGNPYNSGRGGSRGGYQPGHYSYGRGGHNRPSFPGSKHGGDGLSTNSNQQGGDGLSTHSNQQGPRVFRQNNPQGPRVFRQNNPQGPRVFRQNNPQGPRVFRQNNPQGPHVFRQNNPQAKSPGVISWIVGAVVVALGGAISSFYAYQQNLLCFREDGEEGEVNMEICFTIAEPAVQQTLLER